MVNLTTPAIILRKVEYGDFDLILTLLTLGKGKLSAIAKSARKSTKRFGGILELFSNLDIVCSDSKTTRLPVLQEAVLKEPFAGIRADIIRTAYASYWSELIDTSSEEGQKQPEIYRLLQFSLRGLDRKQMTPDALSVLFQIRLVRHCGYGPDLSKCRVCGRSVDQAGAGNFQFELARGRLVCRHCATSGRDPLRLSVATLKQLQWIESGGLSKAGRVRLSSAAIEESLRVLEAFVPYQLGKEPRSLRFLQQVREK